MTGDARAAQPVDGWPPAACKAWRTHHPAHGHTIAGTTHWCSPAACAKVARQLGDQVEQAD